MVYQIKKFLSKELILLDKVFYIQKIKGLYNLEMTENRK